LKGFIPLYDLLQSPHNLILRSSQTTFFPASFFFPVPEVGSSHTPIKNKINLKKKKGRKKELFLPWQTQANMSSLNKQGW
jgi:hypothetical protein